MHFIKTALRVLKRYKLYSFLNILGLAVGIASALIIALVVHSELSYETHHKNRDTLYRVNKRYSMQGQMQVNASTPYPLLATAVAEIPEVENGCHFSIHPCIIKYNDTVLRQFTNYHASPSLFECFSFDFIYGSAATALPDKQSIVLSESAAKRYFGTQDPMGKTLLINNAQEVTVTGVFADMPELTSFDFGTIQHIDTSPYIDDKDNWFSHWMQTYVLLSPQADTQAVTAKLDAMMKEHLEENSGAGIQSLATMHLYDVNGVPTGQKFVRIFSAVALLILVIACINFMNLATAQATKRAREVGIRKIAGARRAALIGQFIGESLLYTALAYVIAIFLAELSLPLFSQIAGHTISISLLSLPMILVFIGTWAVIGLAAGSYPAFVLASFKPASILKTTLAGTGRGLTLRTIIVIVQFTLAVILLIGTGVIYSQLHYIQTTDRGFDSDNLLSLRMNRDLASKYEQFRTLVASNPAIKTITQTSATPDMVWSVMRGINWEGAPEDANSAFAFIAADHNYLDATGITILQGRNFRSDSPADANAILINEKSMEMLGIADPIGLKLDDGNMEVVGVVQNFNSLPLNYPIEALMIVNMPQYYRMVLLKLDGTNTKEAMQAIEAAWQKVCPDFPFEYRFMDQNFDSTYRSEITAGRLFQVFAMLGIFIACLGLFGLASFLAEQKRLEIGIRKVLGSSSAGIVWHLCRQFVRWIIIANVIAWPLAWYFMRNWLQSFVYRTSINPIIFLLAGVLSVSIAVLTIVARTLHTAQMNPAKALKYE